MLPKSKRLNLKKDFKWVAAGLPRSSPRGEAGAGGAGKKLETKNLKIFINNGENEQARIGVAISSKNFKKATDRNRAKRLVSHAFQSIYSTLPSNINIIALPKTSVLSVKSSELEKELRAINAEIVN